MKPARLSVFQPEKQHIKDVISQVLVCWMEDIKSYIFNLKMAMHMKKMDGCGTTMAPIALEIAEIT